MTTTGSRRKYTRHITNYRKVHTWYITSGSQMACPTRKKKKIRACCLVCVRESVCPCVGQLQACCFSLPALWPRSDDPYQTSYECTCKCTETRECSSLRGSPLHLRLALTNTVGTQTASEVCPHTGRERTCHITKRGTFFSPCRQPSPFQPATTYSTVSVCHWNIPPPPVEQGRKSFSLRAPCQEYTRMCIVEKEQR